MLQSNGFVANYFDSVAEQYENNVARAGYFATKWISENARDLQDLAHCDVLDLGCGTGLNVKALHAKRDGIHAYGLDVSPKMIEQARASGRYANLNVHDLNCAMPEISSERFDLAIAFGFLEMLSDVHTCLSECHRALRWNGLLWASFRCYEAEDEGSPARQISVGGIQLNGYSKQDIHQLMQQVGMSVLGIEVVTGFVTGNSFAVPFYIVRARKRPPASS